MFVVPALVAHGETIGLFILAAAVAVMLWVDIRASRAGQAPH